MWGVYTRRQYLEAAGAVAGLAGYNDYDDQTSTARPVQQLVIPSGDEHVESSVTEYTGIEWHDSGRLVIENGAGLRLRDREGNQ